MMSDFGPLTCPAGSSAKTTARPVIVDQSMRRHSDSGNGLTSLEMPVDVTVKEPWARVVGLEADADLTASDTDNVAARRVDKVEPTVHALDDIECMTVQVEGVH
jgi:hypothetical protein